MARNDKFYAVALIDGRTGIFTDWGEAQKFIQSCPSSAKYKKLGDRPSAQDYLDSIGVMTVPDAAPGEPACDPGVLLAYVDGSFNPKTSVWGYGVCLTDPNKPGFEPIEVSGSGTKYADSNNAIGEVYAAMTAVKHAIDLGYKDVLIVHDHDGVQAWVTGQWDATIEMTRVYRDWMRRQGKKIGIKFRHVKGHSGDPLNERVDRLAKQGCGVA